jgi:hypothetical protein
LTTVGFRQHYSASSISATINSNGEIVTSVSMANANSLALRLCAVVDYMKEKYSFGYGFTIGDV